MLHRFIRLLRRLVLVIGALALAYLALVAALTLGNRHNSASTPAPTPAATPAPPHIVPQPVALATTASQPRSSAAGDCRTPAEYATAAAANAGGMAMLAVAPFGVAETGWEVYAPLIAREIGTGCAGDSSQFAARLAGWQQQHGLARTGQVDAATLTALTHGWLHRRPFTAALAQGCPPSPEPAQLVPASAAEAYGGKPILARPAALSAYRRMVAAARADGLANPPLLQIASAWRGPDDEAARCADGSCGTAAKASCSAHRTGLAFDLMLGAAPGSDGFSTAPAHRLWVSRTPIYRWLVAHADRFGFVNYPYEPWHWEWTGEKI